MSTSKKPVRGAFQGAVNAAVDAAFESASAAPPVLRSNPAAAPVLAVLTLQDGANRATRQHLVTHWPLVLGRGLSCDAIVQDPHVAPAHLRLSPSAQGGVEVELLQTENGARLGARQHGLGSRFTWKEGETLTLGRSTVTFTMADSAAAPERPLPRGERRTLALGVGAGLLGALAVNAFGAWSTSTEAGALAKQLPMAVAVMLASLVAWGLVWAAATKLFAARLGFWQHLRIACCIVVGTFVLEAAAEAAAFAFSWEWAERMLPYLFYGAIAVGVWWHLGQISPQSRRRNTAWVLGLALLGAGLKMGFEWQQHQRIGSQLYMSELFLPSWRVAPAVAPAQFFDEARILKSRLQARTDNPEDATGDGFDELD